MSIPKFEVGERVFVNFMATRNTRSLYQLHVVGIVPVWFLAVVVNPNYAKGRVEVHGAEFGGWYSVPVEAITKIN